MLAPYLIDSGITINIERIGAMHNAYRFYALHQVLLFFVNNRPLEVAAFKYFINLRFVNGFVVLLIRQQTMDSSAQGRGVNIARTMRCILAKVISDIVVIYSIAKEIFKPLLCAERSTVC